MKQELFITFGAGDWRISHRDSLQSYFSGCITHFGDDPRVHVGIMDQATLADVGSPRFEVRFHQGHDVTAGRDERRQDRKDVAQ